MIQILYVCNVVDPPGDHQDGIADQARTIRIPVHMVETINKLIRVPVSYRRS